MKRYLSLKAVLLCTTAILTKKLKASEEFDGGVNSTISHIESTSHRGINAAHKASSSVNPYLSWDLNHLQKHALDTTYNRFMEFDTLDELFEGAKSLDDNQKSDPVLLKEYKKASLYKTRLDYFIAQIKDFEQYLEALKSQGYSKYTILLGKSRIGKTVLMNVLQEKDLTYTTHVKVIATGDGVTTEFESSDNMLSAGEDDGIGHSRSSKTFFPVPYVLKGTSSELFIDCPGFGDTRSRCYSLAIAYFLRSLVESGNEFRFLPMASYNQLSNTETADSLQLFKESITSFLPLNEQVVNSIFFVMTKGPRRSTENRYPPENVQKQLEENSLFSSVQKRIKVDTLGDMGAYVNALIQKGIDSEKDSILETMGIKQRSKKGRRGSGDCNTPSHNMAVSLKILQDALGDEYSVSEDVNKPDGPFKVSTTINSKDQEHWFNVRNRLIDPIKNLSYVKGADIIFGWPLDSNAKAKFKEFADTIRSQIAKDEEGFLGALLNKIIPGLKPNTNDFVTLKTQKNTLTDFRNILNENQDKPLSQLINKIRDIAYQNEMQYAIKPLEHKLVFLELIARVEGEAYQTPDESAKVRSQIIGSVDLHLKKMNDALTESRQWEEIVLPTLETLLLSETIQKKEKRDFYQAKHSEGYPALFKTMLLDLSQDIQTNPAIQAIKKNNEETAADVWNRFAQSQICSAQREQDVKDIISWTLQYSAPVIKTIETHTLKDPLDPSKDIKRNKVKISGQVVKASDIERHCTESISNGHKTGEVYEIGIYASHAFLMDKDVILPGTNVAILAPRWEVYGQKNINLSGRDGKAHAEPKAFHKHPYPGQDGADGKAGLPGESSGHLLVFGLSSEASNKLRERLNGGKGGPGQDAGNGQNGQKGSSANPESITRDDKLLKKFKTNDGGMVHEEFFYGKTGEQGKKGGNSGKIGQGGVGGNSGSFIKIFNDNNVINKEKMGDRGNIGNIGNIGNAGEGGDEGDRAIRIYHDDYQEAGVTTVVGGILTFGTLNAIRAVTDACTSGWAGAFLEGNPNPLENQVANPVANPVASYIELFSALMYASYEAIKIEFPNINSYRLKGDSGTVIKDQSLDVPQNPILQGMDTEQHMNSFDMYLTQQTYTQRHQRIIQETRQHINRAQKKTPLH